MDGLQAPARSRRWSRVGAWCWLLTIVLLAAEPLVASAWDDPSYSFRDNAISDLGNLSCGLFEAPFGAPVDVCSPLAVWMNVAFILVGALTFVGALLTRAYWPPSRFATTGVALVALTGIGGIMVGLAPEDKYLTVHLAGALLQVPGAVGILLLGLSTIREQDSARVITLACGAVTTAACLLFFADVDLGLGMGAMERLAFDAQTVWTTVMGGFFLWRSPSAQQSPIQTSTSN